MPNVSHASLTSGLPPKAVEALTKGSDGSSVAATGSDNTDAAALGADGYVPVTAADGTKGVILSSDLPDGSTQIIENQAANILKIYPPSGAAINGLTATTGAWSLGDNQSAIIVRKNATVFAAIGSPAT